jgi:hypothetical protein
MIDSVNYSKKTGSYVLASACLMIGAMLNRLGGRKKPRPHGVSVFLLQRQLERFSTDRLDRAMQHAWNKAYDAREFFAISIPHDHGAVLRAFGAEIAVRHVDYPLDWKLLGDRTLPPWGAHEGYSVLEYRCPDGPPEDAGRMQMYRGLGMLCAELASRQTSAFFFPLEQVVVPHSVAILAAFRARGPLDPFDLEKLT